MNENRGASTPGNDDMSSGPGHDSKQPCGMTDAHQIGPNKIWLICRLRLRRFVNSLQARPLRWRRSKPRSGTDGIGQRKLSPFVGALVALIMTASFFHTHFRVQERLESRFIRQEAVADIDQAARAFRKKPEIPPRPLGDTGSRDANVDTTNGANEETRGESPPTTDAGHDGTSNGANDDFSDDAKARPGAVAASHAVAMANDEAIPLPPEPGFRAPRVYLEALSVFLACMMLAGLFLTIGLSDLGKPEWDLEWLSTLPISRGGLLLARITERTLISPVLYLAVFPPIALLFWKLGFSVWQAPLMAFGLQLPLFFTLAVWQTVFDTGLRLRFGPSFLRNLQSIFNLLGIVPLYLILFNGYGLPNIIVQIQEKFGAWFLATPSGLLSLMLLSTHLPTRYALTYLGECLALALIGFLLLLWQTRNGWCLSSGQVVGRGVKASGELKMKTHDDSRWTRWLSPLALREWRMLTRDTTYLTQTILIPVLIVFLQLANVTGTGSLFALDSSILASVAFGIASYSLLFTCVQSITGEGDALWILYTLPFGLKDFLKVKMRNWTLLALTMALTLLTVAQIMEPHLDAWSLVRGALALVGVPIYAVIATSLGIFSFTGASSDTEKRGQLRLRPSYLYFYFLVSAMYIACFYIKQTYSIVVLVVLVALFAAGLWQSAMEQLPYLLDASAAPPPKLRLVQGVFAALLFFAVQVVALIAQQVLSEPEFTSTLTTVAASRIVIVSSALAGITSLTALVLYGWSRGILSSYLAPLRWDRSKDRIVAFLDGLWGGFGLIMVTGLYLWALPSFGAWGRAASQNSELILFHDLLNTPWLIVVGCFFVPLAEEILFRGLLLRGLLISASPAAAILITALVFALVHPEQSLLPLLALGALNGFLFIRTRSILPGVVASVVYNLGLMLFLPHWLGNMG